MRRIKKSCVSLIFSLFFLTVHQFELRTQTGDFTVAVRGLKSNNM